MLLLRWRCCQGRCRVSGRTGRPRAPPPQPRPTAAIPTLGAAADAALPADFARALATEVLRNNRAVDVFVDSLALELGDALELIEEDDSLVWGRGDWRWRADSGVLTEIGADVCCGSESVSQCTCA
jgi:hypothetical protein